MTNFDELRGSRRTGCPVCGEPRTGQVAVVLRELGPGAQPKGAKYVSGRAVGLCEQHAIATYERVVEALTGQAQS